MELELTAVFRRVPEGYIAFVEELTGPNSQGATLEEARLNLKEAVALVLEANRALALGALERHVLRAHARSFPASNFLSVLRIRRRRRFFSLYTCRSAIGCGVPILRRRARCLGGGGSGGFKSLPWTI